MEVSAGAKRRERKKKYKEKLEKLLRTYKGVLIVGVDNVGSFQMQKIRILLRNKAVILMGKNTMMRMIIREQADSYFQKLENLLPLVKGNMGLVFTNEDLATIRTLIVSNKVPAAAKTGTFAPTDVFVPSGPTSLDPGQTSFFQALNIATKIVKGAIEILNEVRLIKKGDKVTSSAVALLAKLDIKPFFYGMQVINVYENGSVYPVHVLDLTKQDLEAKFLGGVQRLTAVALAINYPTPSSLPFILASGFKKLFAVSLETGYSFKQADAIKSSSSAAAAAAPAAAAAATAKDDKKAAPKKEEAKKEEPKEEEEDIGGIGGLFD